MAFLLNILFHFYYLYNLFIFVADEDYNKEIINLTFSQDYTRVCFNVSIIDDNIHEQDEFFLVIITTSDPQVTFSSRLTNLTIKSDDGIANNVKSSFPRYRKIP